MKPWAADVRNVSKHPMMLSFFLDAYLALGFLSVARVLFVQLTHARVTAS